MQCLRLLYYVHDAHECLSQFHTSLFKCHKMLVRFNHALAFVKVPKYQFPRELKHANV